MISFHGEKAVKEKYLSRVRAHQSADNLIRGTGWDGSKGCAVGCTLEKYDHSRYETELGIPEWLARVEDTLFEGMSEKKSRTWPEEFLKAIPVGANLEPAKDKYIVAILKHTLKSMDACQYDKKKFPEVEKALLGSRQAVKQMIECIKGGLDTSAAWSAASAAESAAWSAARSAARSAAWSAAESAAWSAAESAARSAAESAAWSAARSAASAARSAAESAAYDHYADELIKILKKCK